jgi:plastocyanin
MTFVKSLSLLLAIPVVYFGPALPVHAQAIAEGVVQLPKPGPDLGINQGYQPHVDLPIVPANPPAAVVYLEGDFSRVPRPVVHATGQMPQKNITFAPDLIAVLVGTTVEFPNLDDTYHNVFSYSKTKRFDLGRYRRDEKPGAVLFDKPGAVTVHCDIHDRMRGTVLVLETPFFVKTDTKGNYRLEHLPPGNYLLKAWVTERDVRERPVELKNGSTLRVDFPGK